MRDVLTLDGPDAPVRVGRGPGGVVTIEAESPLDLAYAQGWAHARDRQVQLVFTRTVAQGRLAEVFGASEEAEATDTFMRRVGLEVGLYEELARLPPETRAWADAYAAGATDYMGDHRRPFEFLVAGVRPEPWAVTDTLLTLKVMAYVGLAQGQQDGEKFVVQALRRGADAAFLRDLFGPHLDDLDEERIAELREITLAEPLLAEPSEDALRALPAMASSNNWVLTGRRTASGQPMLATDPHLEIDRLPAVWCEMEARLPGRWAAGASMPGVPGLAMGRTQSLAFGFTYGCMDQIDYFMEDCREGAARVGDAWEPFRHRVEVIWRKGKEPLLVDVFANDRGVLEGDPRVEGRYLCRAWSAQKQGSAETLAAIHAFQDAGTVAEAQELLKDVAVSGNWLLADADGHIGYQQSGLLPRRRRSGMSPGRGWDPSEHWVGMVPGDELHRVTDPESGFLATTNDPQPTPAEDPPGVTLCSGHYRKQRIDELLGDDRPRSLGDLKAYQLDVVSPQARRFLRWLRPLLPATDPGRQLAAWEGDYAIHRVEPVWFEAIYEHLMAVAFGGRFGEGIWEEMIAETGFLNDLHWDLDRLFFDPDERWIPSSERDRLGREVAEEVLTAPPTATWGQVNQVTQGHLMLGGRAPKALGFDVGPVPVAGCRATLNQGRVYRSHGRGTSFAPSWRMVTDLAEAACETALPGGASDRRWSRHYVDGLAGWFAGEYKRLGPEA